MKLEFFNKIDEKYKSFQDNRKEKIRQEPNKSKRFWKWVWFFISFPFVWVFYNIRDFKTAIIFGVVFLIYSGSVWGFYLAAIFCGWTATEAGRWLIGTGTAVWAWWLSPLGSPFILLCIGTTVGVKALFNKVFHKKKLTSKNTK